MEFDPVVCNRINVDSLKYMNRENFFNNPCREKFIKRNLVQIYYLNLSENTFLMFTIILLAVPLIFVFMGAIADRYLSLEMKKLAHKLKMSPSVAAMTLIAFANGAPDIITSFETSTKKTGVFMTVGAMYGSFLFSSTFVLWNVVSNFKNVIRVPKLSI